MLLLGKGYWRLLLFVFTFASLGCGERFSSSDSYKFLLPWQTNGAGHSLQEIEINTLKSPYVMEGQAAQVYSDIQLSEAGFSGQIAEPKLLQTNSKLYIVTDIYGLYSVAIYAHFESLKRLDEQLNLNHLTWPRKIGVNINFLDNEGKAIPNNALYIQDYDAIVVTPYSRDGLPFFVNGAVLAHEHFHAHFYHLLKKPLYAQLNVLGVRESPVYEHNVKVLRSWNEGLADFWSYVYSSDFDPIGRSLEEYKRGRLAKLRSLKEKFSPFQGLTQLKKNWRNGASSPYKVGTKIARFLVSLLNSSSSKELEGDSIQRLKLAKWVMERLGTFHRTLGHRFSSEELLPSDLILHLFGGEAKPIEQDCESLRYLLSKNENHRAYKKLCLVN